MAIRLNSSRHSGEGWGLKPVTRRTGWHSCKLEREGHTHLRRSILTFVIRPATEADAAGIAAFCRDIRLDTVPIIHSEQEVALWIRETLIARQSSWVLAEQEKIVGWIDVHRGCLEQLYCPRGETGKGFGKRLLDFAKQLSPDGLKLFTFQVNSGARRFYAREGFVEDYWGDGSDNEEGEPDVRMVWSGAP